MNLLDLKRYSVWHYISLLVQSEQMRSGATTPRPNLHPYPKKYYHKCTRYHRIEQVPVL